MGEKKKKGSISYAKWGYIFIAPFFIIFAVFQLIPLAWISPKRRIIRKA